MDPRPAPPVELIAKNEDEDLYALVLVRADGTREVRAPWRTEADIVHLARVMGLPVRWS